MSFLRTLVRHTSVYAVGEGLAMAAGLVSFPIFTRLLSKEDYGLMSLVTVTLTMADAAFSLGLRHSGQRFYGEYAAAGRADNFYATMLGGAAGGGLAATVTLLAAAGVLALAWPAAGQMPLLIAVAALLVSVRLPFQTFGCLYRVQEHSGSFVFGSLASRYLSMGGAVFGLTILGAGLSGLYLGQLTGEALALALVAFFFLRRQPVRLRHFSIDSFRKMVRFGFPLIIAGFGAMLLSLGDRYVIGFFLGSAPVAVYSVAYNLCLYLGEGLITAFQFAFVPMIMNEWGRGEHDAVSKHVSEVIRIYGLAALFLFAFLAALGRDVIVFLASAKYTESAALLAPVAAGVLAGGVFTPCAMGMILMGETRRIAVLNGLAAAGNIALNLLLIPRFGLQGAAWATLISYVLLLVAARRRSETLLAVRLPWGFLWRYGLAALAMYGFLVALSFFLPGWGLFTKTAAGVLAFFAAVCLLDRDARALCGRALTRPRLAGPGRDGRED